MNPRPSVYMDRPPVGDWAEDAACKGMRIFFPTQDYPGGWKSELVAQVAAARAVCAGCEVKAECLAHALATDEPHGIWGGMTVGQRKRLAGRTPRPPPAIKHGTLGGYIAHLRRNIPPCAECRSASARYHRQRAADRRATA